MTDLRRHVPRVALEWDDEAPGTQWQSVDATLVFADISGFTALTERLARARHHRCRGADRDPEPGLRRDARPGGDPWRRAAEVRW